MAASAATCAACCLAVGAATPAVLKAQVQAPVGIATLRAPAVPSFQGSSPTAQGRPALEPARVAGEVLAGAYAGMGGYLIGSLVGGVVTSRMPGMSDAGKDRVKFATGVVGATAATAAAVSGIGNIGDQTGSYPVALAGTAAGVTAGILLNQLLYGHARLPSETGSSRARWLEASLEALLPSIGATIAFNSTRRFK